VTEADREAARIFLKRRKQSKTLIPKSRVDSGDGKNIIGFQHDDPKIAAIHLANMLATDDFSFALTVHLQLAGSNGNQFTADKVDGALSIVRGMGPRDPLEALLASQMAAIHNATMRAAKHLASSETFRSKTVRRIC
jgi:hypothetical protein